MARQRVNPEREARVRALRNQGLPWNQIKQQLGVGRTGLDAWLRAQGGASSPTQITSTTPVSSIQDLARTLVEGSVLPQQQAIERERQMAEQRAQARAQTLQGFGQAQANFLQGIAPQTEQTFQAAAGMTSAAAKGFSDGMRMALGESAGEANQLLAQQGSPQRVEVGEGAADVLFGLGGFIPSSTLAREGAAFTAAAQRLPATALGVAGQDAARALAEGEKEQGVFGQQLIDLAAQIPSLQTQTVQSLLEFQEQIRQFDVQARQSRTEGDRNFWLEQKQLKLQQAAAALNAEALGLEKKQVEAALTGAIPKGFPGAGGPTFETQLEAAEAAAAAAKAKADAVSARQKVREKRSGKQREARRNRESSLLEARETAFKRARDLYEGETIENPNPRYKGDLLTPNEPKAITRVRRPSYQDALDNIMRELWPEISRFASKSSKAALRRRLLKHVRDALSVAGFRRPPRRRGNRPTGPSEL